jgi:hypothetical protein
LPSASALTGTEVVPIVQEGVTKKFLLTDLGSDVTLGTNTFTGDQTIAGESALRGSAGGGAVSTNLALGDGALTSNTTGAKNTAVGVGALYTNDLGTGNSAVGYNALYYCSGSYNTAIGESALYSNTYAYYNVAIGQAALFANTTGDGNTAVGQAALSANVSGAYNTAVGLYALYSCTNSNNTAVGRSALYTSTSGKANTAIGAYALVNVTTGSGNTSINPLSSNSVAAPVFNPTTENNRFCMGSTAVTNAYIQVAWTVVSDARDKTDFAPVPQGLAFVLQLKPTAYRYKMTRADVDGHGPIRYGFKAQDVLLLEGDSPVIVDAEDPEKLRFNDQSLIAVLVNAIQELSEKFEAYKITHP